VTISATVTPFGAVGTPTGNVQFNDSGSNHFYFGSAPLVNGTASLTISNFPEGAFFITAGYLGDGAFWASSSAGVSQRVHEATTTSIVSTPNPSFPQQNVTFTITVARSAGPSPFGDKPSGTVQLLQGTTVLGTAALSNGSATITQSFSSPGSYV